MDTALRVRKFIKGFERQDDGRVLATTAGCVTTTWENHGRRPPRASPSSGSAPWIAAPATIVTCRRCFSTTAQVVTHERIRPGSSATTWCGFTVGCDDLLLGRAFLRYGPFRPSLMYFVLEAISSAPSSTSRRV